MWYIVWYQPVPQGVPHEPVKQYHTVPVVTFIYVVHCVVLTSTTGSTLQACGTVPHSSCGNITSVWYIVWYRQVPQGVPQDFFVRGKSGKKDPLGFLQKC